MDITSINELRLVDIHRDREPVPGKTAYFPAANMIAFYPDRDFAYDGVIYFTATYENREMARGTFRIRPLPTFIQGFVADQYMKPVPGIRVHLPELDRIAKTDSDGNFGFGFGENAANIIPGGRYKMIVNPNLQNKTFGAVEKWVFAKEGRLTSAGMTILPLIDTNKPMRYIESGKSDNKLGAEDLVLDLSNASLFFPDGSDKGAVHFQFLGLENISYPALPPAVPHWVYTIQPAGIEVRDEPKITIKMPELYKSYEYIEHIGKYVVLVGFDPDALQIVPVGVGLVNKTEHKVKSVGKLHLKRLDYIGYAILPEDHQEILQEYAEDKITLTQIINEIK